MSILSKSHISLMGVTAAISLFSVTIPAWAEFPEHPIRIVVPNPPGSNSDILVRQIAPKLQDNLGQPVVVDNRTGGGEMIGPSVVAHSAPDGYTILFGTSTDMAAAPSLYTKMAYDPVKDFSAVGLLGRNPQVLAVNASLPVNTVQDLIAYVKAHPGKLNYSTVVGGPFFASAWFANLAKLDIQQVTYPSGPQAILDVVTGTMTYTFSPYGPIQPQVAAGKLKVIGVTSDKRVPWLPNVPTMAESGLPDLVFTTWVGFYAPAKTPADVIAKLHDATSKSLQDPQIQKAYQDAGSVITPMTPQETDKFTLSEIEEMRKLVKISGAKVQ